MRARIRRVSPPLEGDRPYYRDIAALEGLIADGELRG
jgi:histidine ammonia-lyase